MVLGLITLQVDCHDPLSTIRSDAVSHAVCIRKVLLTMPAAVTCTVHHNSAAVSILQTTSCYGLLLPEAFLPVHHQSLCA